MTKYSPANTRKRLNDIPQFSKLCVLHKSIWTIINATAFFWGEHILDIILSWDIIGSSELTVLRWAILLESILDQVMSKYPIVFPF